LPEKAQLTSNATPNSVTTTISYHHLQEQSVTAQSAQSSSKQLFLPPYLQPDSDSRDISSLVDELTPIQAELGPCPFIPSDWDERRTELVRRYAAIYGQGSSRRKNEELSLHEENINVAAFQLCLRDPTLLARREELLMLSRKAIKDGGYTFQHGLSKAKVVTSETTTPNPSLASHKQALEAVPSLDDSGTSFPAVSGVGNMLPPLPRNMSREKKLKRVEELEFLIAKNKTKQSIKLTALEKARLTNDFSMSHHLQAEIESLGNTLASLQEEYSNMKYRLRRSDRYFEKKIRKLEDVEGRTVHPGSRPPAGDLSVAVEVVPKRMRLQPGLDSGDDGPNEELISGARERQQSFHSVSTHDNDRSRLMECSETGSSKLQPISVGSTGTVVSFPRMYTKVTSTSSEISAQSTSHVISPPPSLPSPPPSHSPLCETSLTYLEVRPTAVATQALSGEEGTDSGEGGEGERRDASVATSPREAQNSERLTQPAGDLSSNRLLANINKLATQAAANLRSLPHF
jgi:hypothetical protein